MKVHGEKELNETEMQINISYSAKQLLGGTPERWQRFFLVCGPTLGWYIYHNLIFSDFAVNKITARVWRRLHALWNYKELSLTNHSALLNAAILKYQIKNTDR